MTNFRNLVFVKNATNKYGAFRKGDRAQARFPQELTDSYLRHGILAVTDAPIPLDESIKDYTPKKTASKRAAKSTK